MSFEKSKIEDAVLGFLRSEAERPASIKEIARELGIPKDQRREIERAVRGLADDGLVVMIRGGRFGVPKRMNLVNGALQCHRDGFGFVIPEDGEGGDVFIGARKMKGAMHGDTVVARVEGTKPGGKREGSVIRILKRAHSRIVGRFAEKGGGVCVVEPSDERILGELIIEKGGRIAGIVEGDVVEAEVTRFPDKHMHSPIGRIVEKIGRPEDPGVEIEITARKYGLPSKFPAPVRREVEGVPMEVTPEDVTERVDLRRRRIFTIDGETAKDFDDAVGIERTDKGYRLLVSIADVSRYVRPGTELDREAAARSTSVYFPGRCIPMLPEELSNGICSLNPRVDRLTLTCELEFDARGRVESKKFYESVIKTVERMTYTAVAEILSGGEARQRYAHIEGDLKIMEELAAKLRAARINEGSIDFDLPEPEIILDINGRPQDIIKSERNVAHRIIEEFMLSANKAAAEEFSSRAWPFIYRIHARPDDDSIAEFRDFAAGLGFEMDKGEVTPKTFQKALSWAAGRPEERLVNHVLLRSMRQAVYSPDNAGHFGLAFRDYTHFTSPIRRYPDLIVHRLIKKLLRREYSEAERERAASMLPGAALHASTMERKAMEAERDVVDLKKAQFMQDKTGESYDGFISGVTSFGIFVELKEWFVEGLIHVTSLTDDYYKFAEKEHSLVGERTKRRFRLGAPLRVRVVSVDIERRRIDMELDEPTGVGAAEDSGAAKRAQGRRSGRPASKVFLKAKESKKGGFSGGGGKKQGQGGPGRRKKNGKKKR